MLRLILLGSGLPIIGFDIVSTTSGGEYFFSPSRSVFHRLLLTERMNLEDYPKLTKLKILYDAFNGEDNKEPLVIVLNESMLENLDALITETENENETQIAQPDDAINAEAGTDSALSATSG
jgi:hypothetical protein